MTSIFDLGKQTPPPDSLDAHYQWLEPHIEVFEPDDDIKRPALLIFHGCGGKRPFLTAYAKLAATMGMRAFIIDSSAPRGWDRRHNIHKVCTGRVLHGNERAWDVLAAIKGIGERDNVDASNLILSGWSHGGWAITDLMTYDLPPEQDRLLQGVKGLFLVYPFLNIPSRTALRKPWHHHPETALVAAQQDHVIFLPVMKSAVDKLRKDGISVTLTEVNATHAFDEGYERPETPENALRPMRHDKAAFAQALEALQRLIEKLVDVRAGLGATPVMHTHMLSPHY